MFAKKSPSTTPRLSWTDSWPLGPALAPAPSSATPRRRLSANDKSPLGSPRHGAKAADALVAHGVRHHPPTGDSAEALGAPTPQFAPSGHAKHSIPVPDRKLTAEQLVATAALQLLQPLLAPPTFVSCTASTYGA